MIHRFRNLPDGTDPETIRGLHVNELLLPTLTVRDSALRRNLSLLQRWCAERGVSHAPHAKTHLSPELTRLQLEHGAWAMTAATVAQARLLRDMGATRVLLANQVADVPGLRWLRASLADPGFTVIPLVDSPELVALMDAQLAPVPAGRRLPVLLELGIDGGRTGARSPGTALAVAAAVRDSRSLTLVGVECFEGLIPPERTAATVALVDEFLDRMARLAAELDHFGLFGDTGMFSDAGEILISAGGSAFFDRLAVARDRMRPLSRPVRAVIRAGGYLVHDRGPLGGSSPLTAAAAHPLGALEPALELWAAVQSAPEPGLAIAGFGKRDASFDIDLPTILGVRRDGNPEFAPADLRVDRLNDQHAYIVGSLSLAVGDVLRFGVTHSCTTFDKWQLIAVLGDDDRVVGAVTTIF